MKLTDKNIITRNNRATRYLAQKQFEQDQKQHRDMDRFMAFACGISVCVIIHFLGAL